MVMVTRDGAGGNGVVVVVMVMVVGKGGLSIDSGCMRLKPPSVSATPLRALSFALLYHC